VKALELSRLQLVILSAIQDSVMGRPVKGDKDFTPEENAKVKEVTAKVLKLAQAKYQEEQKAKK
jgi:hypothetical protein